MGRTPEPYVPGNFFHRELPGTLKTISPFLASINAIIIDGYVWMDSNNRPGLGAKIYEAVGEKTAIIGIAKTHFHGTASKEVYRGGSKKPLFIKSVGFSQIGAAQLVTDMSGRFRIPTIIRRADFLSRHGLADSP